MTDGRIRLGTKSLLGVETHVDPNVEEDGRNKGTQNQNHGKKDVGQDGDVPKKPDRNEYYNEDDL